MPTIPALPNELLTSIIEEVESNNDLLSVARVSRALHDISLLELFGRFAIDVESRKVRLASLVTRGNETILRGLAIYLGASDVPFDDIYYDCGYVNNLPLVISEARLLCRFIQKLSSVRVVTLRLYAPPTLEASDLSNVSVQLLQSILARGCRELFVRTTQLSSAHHKENVLLHPLSASSTSSKSAEWLWKYLPGPGYSYFPAASVQQGPESCSSTPSSSGLLVKSTIHTFPHFLRPFLYNSIRANSASLTHLTFQNIFGGDVDFATLLTDLHLPNLHHFSVKYGVVWKHSIVGFLLAHPHLQSLEYHHIKYRSIDDNIFPRATTQIQLQGPTACRGITTLAVSPEHIINFLPTLSSMPQLISLTIRVECQSATNFSALEEALASLKPCHGPLQLSLEVSNPGLGFGYWFSEILRASPQLDRRSRPEADLTAVEKLIVDNGDWPLTEDFYLRVPRWAGLFPRLKELVLKSTFAGGSLRQRSVEQIPLEEPLEGSFAEVLKSACYGLEKVSVVTSGTWTHTYSG